jgi:ornithine cyclodeaminase/alanine dehydrogenase-like protein (mu-crystallin family)
MTELLILDADAVRRTLPMRECIDAMHSVMRCVSRGGAQMPLRTILKVPGSDLLFGAMPGCLDEPASFGAKLLSVRSHPTTDTSPSHIGVFVLFDAASGRPIAIVDASELTAIRTAAATAVATQALARRDAHVLAILGTGEQAARHLEALAIVCPLLEVRVWGRSAERAAAFAARHPLSQSSGVVVAAEARAAVTGADVICTTTASREPILNGAWLSPGVHVNLVGASTAAAREADDAVVARSRFFVDFRPSALAQAGELRHAIEAGAVTEDHIRGEIGEVLNGSVDGRTAASDITAYKSLGIAAQDLAAAHRVYQRAVQLGLGRCVPF